VVIVFSIVYFGERLALLQWFGILMGIAVVVILAQDARRGNRSDRNARIGFLFVVVCIFCGAIASISSKLAAESVNKAGFMALSYLLGTFFSLGIEKQWGQGLNTGRVKPALVIGAVMGVLNFVGFYAFLSALDNGPLSAIALITGMHFVIAIILSVLIYHERLSIRRSLGVGLTLLAVYLLRY